MKFRWHRGSLDESMDTVSEFGSLEELVVLLNLSPLLWFPAIELSSVSVEPYGFDDRIGWDTHIVTVNGNAVGFTDSAVPTD